jgi:hypothetical protein
MERSIHGFRDLRWRLPAVWMERSIHGFRDLGCRLSAVWMELSGDSRN